MSTISNIPYNLIFTTKLNDSLILITIISWGYFNLSLANEYVGDVTIPTQDIKYNQFFSRQISQSDCSIHIKLNYLFINLPGCTTRCRQKLLCSIRFVLNNQMQPVNYQIQKLILEEVLLNFLTIFVSPATIVPKGEMQVLLFWRR